MIDCFVADIYEAVADQLLEELRRVYVETGKGNYDFKFDVRSIAIHVQITHTCIHTLLNSQ